MAENKTGQWGRRAASHPVRLFIFMVVTAAIVVGLSAAAVFFVVIQGAEQVLVPDVRGKDLTDALLELQVKELYPRIQLRYSQSADEKGTILEQDPKAGTIVKAGRRVKLTVSQGVVLNTIEDYLGRNIDEVRIEIQTTFAAVAQPLLSVVEPYLYQYASVAAGTIIGQSPEAGAPISSPTGIQFVVSRGPEKSLVETPALAGLDAAAAAILLGEAGLRFSFSSRPIREGEAAGLIAEQGPAAGTATALGGVVSLVVPEPADLADSEAFGILLCTLPNNPYPLALTIEAQTPDSGRLRLAVMNHLGGELSFPYRLPKGSTIIVLMAGREMYRTDVP